MAFSVGVSSSKETSGWYSGKCQGRGSMDEDLCCATLRLCDLRRTSDLSESLPFCHRVVKGRVIGQVLNPPRSAPG